MNHYTKQGNLVTSQMMYRRSPLSTPILKVSLSLKNQDRLKEYLEKNLPFGVRFVREYGTTTVMVEKCNRIEGLEFIYNNKTYIRDEFDVQYMHIDLTPAQEVIASKMNVG